VEEAKAEYEQRKNGYDVKISRRPIRSGSHQGGRGTRAAGFRALRRSGEKDLVSKQQRDTAEAAWRIAAAQQQNAQHKLDQLQNGYRPEEIASAEARYHQTVATFEKFAREIGEKMWTLAKASYSYDEARFREREVVRLRPPRSKCWMCGR